MLELVINKKDNIETICLVENGKVVEKYQNDEKAKYNRLEGNIYSGKVIDILPGMQAAFVDFGREKKGFIHFKDAIPQVDVRENKPIEIKDIRKILKPGQRLLVQVKKDSNDKKGAKVSTHITIPSKYVVYMPNTNIVTFSQKIKDEAKIQPILKSVKQNLPKNDGLVIRTAAINATEKEIIEDLKRTSKKWEEIKQKYENSKNTELICENQSIEEKIITDLHIDKIITNNQEKYNKMKQILEKEQNSALIECRENENLLDMYDIEKQIKKSYDRKIWLNCGGFITIDRTEALTAIDVNTAKYTGSKDLETTIFKVNKEATVEIAKQLRLRDIGGIIVIDYIDMGKDENKIKILDLLKEELKKDRAKTQVEEFTKLNLLEMTRKHICSHLDEE